jgi:hypothetical protein
MNDVSTPDRASTLLKSLSIKALGTLLTVLLTTPIFAVSAQSTGGVQAPRLNSVSFDNLGKLVVHASDVGPAGCYLIVNGGLSAGKISTAITSKRASEQDVANNRVAIRTLRRYYCRRRQLYVQLEKVCLGNLVGAALSNKRIVAVPIRNVR